jgi:hypothetical protein
MTAAFAELLLAAASTAWRVLRLERVDISARDAVFRLAGKLHIPLV